MTMLRDTGTWFKSSRSKDLQDCVEVRLAPTIGVRDTKDRDSGHLDVAPVAWGAFVTRLGG
ncbi:DUF397 domain-containing protein [Amycolatopsis sp. CA-230715]|uniref:DUF397 domain-containing protein n=1 Tax=Amycolatopsis sp. CA-230715 TaxID=2745196 RepID=UPI001C342FC1|nr:DUF397 domain-containing protein [Amycolatopsis sp. CA-230715]QWF85295.1 hypothetical protein HUW46_08749 [Amycolatopsis sp. CA-230715]